MVNIYWVCEYVVSYIFETIQGCVCGWFEYFLVLTLGLVFSKSLYFVMAFVQLMVVCLVVILWASLLAALPMVCFYRYVVNMCVWGGGMVVFFSV